MRISPPFLRRIEASAALVSLLCLMTACKPDVKPPGPPKPAAPAPPLPMASTNKPSAESVSFFDDLMPPKGRDPFFPNSHRRDPIPVVTTHPDKPASLVGDLRLMGIMGTPNHRLAIINGVTFDTGEQDTIRVPNGRVKVKCVEIGEDYAVVMAEGEAQPKRLDLSKKGF
jgi:hypothetical protein